MLNSDGSLFRAIESNCFCAAKRIEECDHDGISIQVLSAVPGTGFNYEKKAEQTRRVAQFLNDDIAEVVKNGNGRFVGKLKLLWTVRPSQRFDTTLLWRIVLVLLNIT